MFERTPCKHPVVVLKDVGHKDLEFLISYMYGGEVSVTQNDLPSLIKAAETLRIKGLAAPDEPPSDEGGGVDKSTSFKVEETLTQSLSKKIDEGQTNLVQPRVKRKRTSYSSGSSAPCSDNNEDEPNIKSIKSETTSNNNLSSLAPAENEGSGIGDEQEILNNVNSNSSSIAQMFDDNQPLDVSI